MHRLSALDWADTGLVYALRIEFREFKGVHQAVSASG